MADHVEDIDRTDEAIAAINDGLPASVEEIHGQTVARMQRMMAQGRDALGRPWTPLKPSTVAAKGSSVPLVDSGDLMDSLEEDSEFREDENLAIFASGLPYAGTHEYGLPEQNIPPRPFLQPGLKYAIEISDDVFSSELDARVQAVLF